MKGQRLFVRATTVADQAELATYRRENHLAAPDGASRIFVARLAGTLVGMAEGVEEENALRITLLHVQEQLRRKRVAQVLVAELQQIVVSEGLDEGVAVASDCPLRPYFERLGFRWRGGKLWAPGEKRA
jgi:predicted N-acetyltransferase YhbS